jgi:hypothetical protein
MYCIAQNLNREASGSPRTEHVNTRRDGVQRTESASRDQNRIQHASPKTASSKQREGAWSAG